MISSAHRFHGHNSLNYAYQHGKTLHNPKLSLKFVNNQRQQSYRVAVVVSKKTSKSAVVRNRIRRRLYEAVRQQKNTIQQPYDIVLTVFDSELANAPASEINKLLADLIHQAGIK